MSALFVDRADAGRQLARALLEHGEYRGANTVVLGLPRGGIPVARQVADAIGAPLDALAIRKLGSPMHPEFAVGAIGENGVRVVDPESVRMTGLRESDLAAVEARERLELARRSNAYRSGKERLDLRGKRVIVVDDGVATGASATVACRVARQLGAAEIILAVPVAPHDWTDTLGGEADVLVAVATPRNFWAVGQWYARFNQTTDEEVIACLAGDAR